MLSLTTINQHSSTKKKHVALTTCFVFIFISLYIYKSKCTYCNFNKYVNPSDPPTERLTRAMIRELEFYLTESRFDLLHNKRVTSIYFGGGTPSKNKKLENIIKKKGGNGGKADKVIIKRKAKKVGFSFFI